MAEWLDKVENVYFEGRIKVPYKWYVGEVGSRFLVALRDKKEFWGTKCPKCNTVYVPPQKNCGECFVPADTWVQVKDTGTLESFTVVHYSHTMQPDSSPLIYGLIKLDGADGSILHLVDGVDPKDLKVGVKMKAVFSEKREGTILDISHFAPV